jgi:hypothetical protein
VWRYRNADNYYITRCNALEDNCTIYHVINGSRRPFQNHSVKVASNVWHTLKMEARGNHFVVWFDGAKVLDARDDTFQAGQARSLDEGRLCDRVRRFHDRAMSSRDSRRRRFAAIASSCLAGQPAVNITSIDGAHIRVDGHLDAVGPGRG